MPVSLCDPRDSEILRLRAEGLTYDAIAARIGIRLPNVTYRIDRMKKRGVAIPARGEANTNGVMERVS